MDVPTIFTVAAPTALLAAGAAWGAARQSLNGTRERVKRIESGLAEHIKEDQTVQRDMIDRAARIETKVDILLSK